MAYRRRRRIRRRRTTSRRRRSGMRFGRSINAMRIGSRM